MTSISANTTCFTTSVSAIRSSEPGVFIRGAYDGDASGRIKPILQKLSGMTDWHEGVRIETLNSPVLDAKGLGFSSSAGAAMTLACYNLFQGGSLDAKGLSKVARLFSASSSRSFVGGFARLHAGKDDEDTYAERIAGQDVMDLRMVIVPLPISVKTDQMHREAETSPFFEARVEAARRRCDQIERSILRNDLKELGELVEKDTLELHGLSMTGQSNTILMTEDSLRIIRRVRELRSDGVDAYFSMDTGPSVFINTSAEYQESVAEAMKKMGYDVYLSSVGDGARAI